MGGEWFVPNAGGEPSHHGLYCKGALLGPSQARFGLTVGQVHRLLPQMQAQNLGTGPNQGQGNGSSTVEIGGYHVDTAVWPLFESVGCQLQQFADAWGG